MAAAQAVKESGAAEWRPCCSDRLPARVANEIHEITAGEPAEMCGVAMARFGISESAAEEQVAHQGVMASIRH